VHAARSARSSRISLRPAAVLWEVPLETISALTGDNDSGAAEWGRHLAVWRSDRDRRGLGVQSARLLESFPFTPSTIETGRDVVARQPSGKWQGDAE